jgi:hypothetical protein
VLGALEEPAEHRVDWPKEWPAPPPGLKPKAGTFFCAPVNAEPSDFSSTLVNAKWGDIGRTALVIDANTSAVIWDWYFDLPAEIPTMNEKGEPAPPIGNSCAHVARP